MQRKHKTQKMTLDRLAASIQRELLGVGKKFDRLDERILRVEEKVVDVGQKIVGLDHKIDTVRFEIVDEVRKENLKVIESNDRVVTKLDRLLKDSAAHDAAHRRLEDSVHGHEVRLKKLEQVPR